MSKPLVSFHQVLTTSPLVHRMWHSGALREDIIVAQENQIQELIQRIMELESIAPKKMRGPNGEIMIYHCPDELIKDPSP